MARFQVFVPKSEQVPLDNLQPQQPLEAVGLADLIVNAAGELSIGPEEQEGILISWPTPGDTETGYKPERQTWLPAVPRDGLEAKRYWVGIWNDRKPTPKDLLRPYAKKGRSIEMNDGSFWIIPEAHELPCDMILADDGTWKFEVQRKYHDFWLESVDWRRKLMEMEEGNLSISYEESMQFAVRALKVNYMITDEVIGNLRIFGQDSILKSIYAIIGVLANEQ